MGINQLFKKFLDLETLNKINVYFDIELNNLEKKNKFTKNQLIENNIKEHFESIKELLYKYYLPCKAKIYLYNLTYDKIITIYRQLLKLHNYKLISKNYYNNRHKYIIYIIIKTKQSVTNYTDKGIITFD